jgi:N-acetyl-anhydromuramyl-L-alanine amidase AmpD
MAPTSYYFALPTSGKPSPFTIREERVPDWTWYDQNRARSRGGHPINKVTTVVIHATAGWATQHALDNWRIRTASAHWIVPDEDEPQHGQFVWAVVSESLAAYHVKDSKTHPDLGNVLRVNDYSLGIEIVNTQDVQNYTDPFSDWQVRIAAQIVRYCWAKYPNLKHVISHARIDPQNRADPGVQFPWSTFKEHVLDGTNNIQPVALAAATKPVSAFPHLDTTVHGGCCP